MSKSERELFESLIDEIIEKKPSKKELNNLKTKYAKKYSVKKIIKNTQILAHCPSDKRDELVKILNIKPVREISGVTVVALFAKPHKCPHGKCIYCPGGIGSEFGDTPQSYTGAEPAALRAIRNNYDPYFQVFNRLEHYCINGHVPDKIELIFMGGTFPSMDREYREEFVYYTYKAINDFADEFVRVGKNGVKSVDYDKFNKFILIKEDLNSESRMLKIHSRINELKGEIGDFKTEIKKNETGGLRSIGLTIETKPDWAKKEHLNELLEYGCTRLEIGVQSLDDDVLKKINRGHSISDTIECFQVAKDMCFKINAHMMLGLYGSNIEKDKKSLVGLFSDSKFRPDMLKIYPCLVVKGTPLFKLFEKGEFAPVDTKSAAKVIAEAFGEFPRYVRVMRVQRDIPTPNILGGVVHSNLRQYVDKEMTEKGIFSKDIRAREIGFANGLVKNDFKINVEEYESSSGTDAVTLENSTSTRSVSVLPKAGTDYFIDVVNDDDLMIGFIRLRFPSEYGLRSEIVPGTALIRELHVYGAMTNVGEEGVAHQHKGWGKKLLLKAEKIAREKGYSKMAIISGVGVREYYEKQGYKLEGVYMVKEL